MSVKHLFMMIFMIIVFPAMIICYDAEAFFVIMSLILVFISIGNLNRLTAPAQEQQEDIEEIEMEDADQEFSDIGEILGVNIRRLGYGFMIAMNLMVILYFIYALVYVDVFIIRAIAVILIADWMYDIITIIDNMLNGKARKKNQNENRWKNRLQDLYLWFHNISTIGFIISIFVLKYGHK